MPGDRTQVANAAITAAGTMPRVILDDRHPKALLQSVLVTGAPIALSLSPYTDPFKLLRNA
jgi:hypothetical protein